MKPIPDRGISLHDPGRNPGSSRWRRAIIPIATLAAQVMATCAEDTQTPVVYAAISDPEAAELTGIDYVTGTSDALNTTFIMDMMLAQNPDVQKVGLLYSQSEANSTKPIADAKAYLDEKGIAYEEKTANTNDEVITAASALIADDVDAVFTPTDNVIMAAELAIYEKPGWKQESLITPELFLRKKWCIRYLWCQLYRPWTSDR